MSNEKTISLIYTASDKSRGREILDYLTEGRGFLLIQEYDENDISIISGSGIFSDSAIIVVSDDATRDRKWQDAVRSLSMDIRIISIGGTENVDYNNPEVIPERLEEVNAIGFDTGWKEKIWTSLSINMSAYDFLNDLMGQAQRWNEARRSGFTDAGMLLMSDYRECNRRLKIISDMINNEQNAERKAEYGIAVEYLKTSKRDIKENWLSAVKRLIKPTFRIAIGCILVFFVLWLRPYLKRSTYSAAVLSLQNSKEMAQVNAIKLLEGMSNPFVASYDKVRVKMESQLVEYLDLNWSNTPVGFNYKWAINDVVFDEDTEFLWAAMGNGNIGKWDTYSGEIVEQEKVSENPLYAFCRNSDTGEIFAIDSEYDIYKGKNDKWERYGTLPIDEFSELIMRTSADGDLIVSDGSSAYVFYDNSGNFKEYKYDYIYCLDVDQDVFNIVVQNDGNLELIKIDGDKVSEEKIDITLSSTCSPNIYKGKVLIADNNGSLMLFEDGRLQSLGISLPMPAELCFLDVNTIVYHDRNWGTHLYDIEMKADLGGILYAAPALTRLFCRDKTVCGYYNGMYITENVDMLLPASSPASNKIIKAYRDTSDESDDGNVLRSILKKNEYLVECIIDTTEGGYDVVFDGATRLFVGEKQRTDEILEGITDTMGFYSDKYISYVGKPTVLGILNNGHSAVVAASDGSFYELSFNEENGGCLVNSHKQIPTHAAIEEVILCEDYYYLKDTNGYYWKSRIGYTNEYYSDYFEEVKDKIHCAVEDELLEIISPYVAKELELKKLPGGGLEVWE